MEDPNLIATLIPCDDHEAAKNAFTRVQNHGRYVAPTRSIAEFPTISSREATPARDKAGEEDGEGSGQSDCSPRILLRFNEEKLELKNPANGIAFGSHPEKCDIYLGPRGTGGVSGVHFCITFDVEGNIYLNDSSTWGTVVSYSGQAKDQTRRHFSWRLNHVKTEGKWDIQVYVPDSDGLGFKIDLATHERRKAEYMDNDGEFLAHSLNAPPPIYTLNIESYEATAAPSQALSPTQRPIYLRDDKLGSGSFGSVYKIIDASTGLVYAGKYFNKPQNRQEAEWLEDVRREIRIMTSIRHVRPHSRPQRVPEI